MLYENKERYPILKINLNKIDQNVSSITDICSKSNIQITGVIKGCNALLEVTDSFIRNGCSSIGSSRIEQLKMLKSQGINTEMMLLRLPMLCEIQEVVRYSDVSLNSEKTTLIDINRVCESISCKHKVILMYDLGDLREGVWNEEEFLNLAEYIEHNLIHVELQGIGTNLGCYGSIRPTVENMTKLVEMAEMVEARIGRKLEIISGGATSSLPLVFDKKMPERINHLRVGEGILLGKDLKEYFECDVDFLHNDTFILQAQIVEIQEKPSYPKGEIFIDAFGNKPVYEDRGIRKRAILAVGKQDFGDHSKLISTNKAVEVVGSSSDHLIVDITNSDYKIGDILEFSMFYQSMLHLSISDDVKKIYIR